MKWIVVVALAGCTQMTPITATRQVSLSANQIDQIQATVTQDFLDPESAQFRSIRAVDVTLSDGSSARRVCGEVNGRNSLGGYVGFAMFGGKLVNGRFVPEDFFGPCEAF